MVSPDSNLKAPGDSTSKTTVESPIQIANHRRIKAKGSRKYWAFLYLFIFVLIIVVSFMFNRYYQSQEQALRKHFEADIAFLAERVKHDMEEGDLAGVMAMLDQWSMLRKHHCAALSLTRPNGEKVYSRIQSNGGKSTENFQRLITIGGGETVELSMVGDFSEVIETTRYYAYVVAVVIVGIAIALGNVTLLAVRRRKLARQLLERNITLQELSQERERQTDEIQKANQALQSTYDILDSSPAVVFVWKNQQNWPVEFVTENVRTLTGYSSEEFISGGIDYAAIIHPDDLTNYQMEINQQEPFGEVSSHTYRSYRIRTKGGHEKWVQESSFGKMDQSGKVTSFEGVVLDVSARKRLELSLAESETRFRLMADYTNDWEYWIDPEGKYYYLSPSVERFTGYSVDDFYEDGELLFRIVEADYREEMERHFSSALLDMEDFHSHTFALIHKNGEKRWFEHQCRPVHDERGKYLGRRGNNHDITDRIQAEQKQKEIEAQLHHNQKLEMVGTMVGGIAHEFNNILQNISIHLDALQQEALVNEKVLESFNFIVGGTSRARDLVKQILLFTRSEQVELIPQSIKPLVKTAIDFKKKSMSLNTHVSLRMGEGDMQVDCDETQIHQIIYNLVNNADHAMAPHGGVVKIALEQEPTEEVKLTVTDAGMGMDDAVMARIFEPFFTTKSKGQGTGLGLSAVHGMVETMGGTITAKSERGKGSTFTVRLPLSKTKPEPELVQTPSGILKKRRILFVDDERGVTKGANRILSNLGMDVEIAHSYASAMGLFESSDTPFDVVITDHAMPGRTGLELATSLKAQSPDLVIVLSSGDIDSSLHKSALASGVDLFITKPWQKAEIIDLLHQID